MVYLDVWGEYGVVAAAGSGDAVPTHRETDHFNVILCECVYMYSSDLLVGVQRKVAKHFGALMVVVLWGGTHVAFVVGTVAPEGGGHMVQEVVVP